MVDMVALAFRGLTCQAGCGLTQKKHDNFAMKPFVNEVVQ